MTVYRLHYFNIRARGEVPRILFNIAGVQFEDVRIEREEWPPIKYSMPFSMLPVLEVDGKRLCQSRAIEAYLAKKFGYDGDNEWDVARVAMVADCVEDFRGGYKPIFFEKDKQKQVELRKKFAEGQMLVNLNDFEEILKENNGGDGYFVGNKLTRADISFWNHVSILKPMGEIDIDWTKWPKLKGLMDRVTSHPAIAEYLARRPDSFR